ncbi:hypothetical protein QBC38DRAFT_426536 [Podospora fimiseda]|uniref:Uncharacterized protein n=1 Tax=Podospora fimiseda TaxID=252190 RepID=A0AAN6YQ10_9PEZI|nr:hypothetical protein QBC38DRAFT_426536 [Podospora fimiseda]
MALLTLSPQKHSDLQTPNGNPNNNPLCGKKIKVSHNGKSVTVKVTDRCPGTDALSTLTFAAPSPPPLTYLYSVNLTFANPITIGSVPYGHRDLLIVNGGNVAGPKLNGKVGTGLDWGLTDSAGIFSPDALYTLHTNDNATILVFEKGHAPHVHILFETASEEYAWLNKAVAYATGGPNENGDIALDVWQIGV